MNVLLVNPKYPDTFWSFKHALKFVSKKSILIPLGLITVSSLLPADWKRKLTDLNVSTLKDKDLAWADFVFIGAMAVQIESVNQVIERCKRLNKKIVAGGPLFTEEFDLFPQVDHLVLNEAEINLPRFIEDYEHDTLKRIYQSVSFSDITKTPIPDYSLVKFNKYATAAIQYSRGCPFDCEFCDITALYGRKVRTKTPVQVVNELDALLKSGWKGSVFFVDDNFIGHGSKLKNDLLPAIIQWMDENNHPFIFTTEASINLADDAVLMQMMVQAGFLKVFIGIETPEENSLLECNKKQNNNRDLIQSVNLIQQAGMEVSAGFIVGFDNDPPNIFQRQVDFIQKSGIINAMVGLLNAPRLSNLYKRLQNEGRILHKFSGDNTDYSMNFVPIMDKRELLQGYQKIVNDIYSSKPYYNRVLQFLKQYNPPFSRHRKITLRKMVPLFKSILLIGILKRDRKYYWSLIFWSLFNKPKSFPLAVTYSIYGYHFRKVFNVPAR